VKRTVSLRPSLGRSGSPEEVALAKGGAELGDHREFRLGFDPFRDHLTPRSGGEVEEAGHNGLAAQIRVHAANQTRVDLDELRPELDEVVEVSDPGAGVIDREANIRAKPEHCLA
jgi:hypothetical protein